MPGIPISYREAKSVRKLLPPEFKKRKNPQLKNYFWPLALLIILGFSFSIFWNGRKSSPDKSIIFLKSPAPDFVGRNEYLEILYKDLISRFKLKDYQDSVKFKVLWGRGGHGKTELAIRFANQFLSYFALAWTFYCDSPEHLSQGYRDLAQKLGIREQNLSLSELREKVHFHLENHPFTRPWVLIFDNVENEILEYPQRGGIILMTSQKQILNPEFILEVKPFSRHDSLELLKRITHEPSSKEMEKLAEDLEGIPLLINYAAHYIKATPGISIKEYQQTFSEQLYRKEGPLWKEMDVNKRYLKSLATSWQFSLQSLLRTKAEALKWLYVCAYLYSEQIPEKWIMEWLAQRALSSTSVLEVEKREILKALQSHGVIRYDKKTKTLSIHRFFQYLIRDSRKEKVRKDLSQAILLLSKHARDYHFQDTSSWRKGEDWFMHACEVEKWLLMYELQWQDPELLRASILFYQGIGRFCFFREQYTVSLEVNQKILKLKRSLYGDNDSSIGTEYQYHGRVLLKLNRLTEALESCQKAETIQQGLKGKGALDYADTLITKGKILHEQGRYGEALQSHEKGYQIRLKHLGEVHVDVGRALFHMARALNRLRRSVEVIQLSPRIEKIYEKTCGIHHPFYAWALELKAKALRDLGRYLEALKLFERALSILIATLGPHHRDLEYTWDALGWCYYYLEDYKKAKQAFGHVIEGKPAGSIRGSRGYGWSCLKLGEAEAGLHHLTQWLQTVSKIYGRTPKMEVFLEDFKLALQEPSTHPEKLKAAHVGFEISEQELGINHPWTQFFWRLN